jgi:hypothetical protein
MMLRWVACVHPLWAGVGMCSVGQDMLTREFVA